MKKGWRFPLGEREPTFLDQEKIAAQFFSYRPCPKEFLLSRERFSRIPMNGDIRNCGEMRGQTRLMNERLRPMRESSPTGEGGFVGAVLERSLTEERALREAPLRGTGAEAFSATTLPRRGGPACPSAPLRYRRRSGILDAFS